MANRIQQFFIEIIQELKKVTWSGRKETIASTIVVFILVGIMSLFIFFADNIIGIIFKQFLG